MPANITIFDSITEDPQPPSSASGASVGSAIGAAFEVATTIAENPEATSQEILASMTEGAISGGFMGLASGVIAVTGGTAGAVVATYAAAGFVGSFGGSIAKSAIRGEDMSTGSVYINAGIDGLWGAAFGVLAGGMEGPVEGLKTLAIKYGTSLSKQAYKFAKRSITKIGGAFLEGVLGSFNDLLIEQYIEEYIGG